MKRALVLACVLMLAVCLLASAYAAAPKGGYVLLESMKTVPASTGEITLPEGLEKPVRGTGFSAALFRAPAPPPARSPFRKNTS